MATKQAHKRLMKEYASIQKDPPPYIVARPTEKNVLEWHYVITGPPDSVYKGGEYHGKLVFPSNYPFKPPSIQMFTPNGRFSPSVRLCLTMSDFHPELWNPSWSVASILTGLLSFMLESTPTTGSIDTSDSDKKFLARESRSWNREKNSKFCELFPELASQPAYIAEPSPPQSDTPKSTDLSGEQMQNGGQSKSNSIMKQKRPQNVLDRDLATEEINQILRNSSFRMLLGGIILYIVYQMIFGG